MVARDDIQRVAATLARPRIGYVKRLHQTQRALVARSDEAARQLGVFVDRVGDLTIEELGELYDETFRAEATIGPLVERLARQRTRPRGAHAALTTLAPLLDQLDSERNPYACLLRAFCWVLRCRVERSRVHR